MKLVPKAAAAYKQWTGGKQWHRDHVERVRLEANDLKHAEEGLYKGRKLWHEYGVMAIAQLLTFIEAWLAEQKKVRAGHRGWSPRRGASPSLPARVSADAWVNHPGAWQDTVKEDSIVIGSGMVLSLVWWQEEKQILDLNEENKDGRPRR